MIICCWLFL